MPTFYGVDPGVKGAIVGINESGLVVFQQTLDELYIRELGIYDMGVPRKIPSIINGDYVCVEVPAAFSKTAKTIAVQFSLIGILKAHFYRQQCFFSTVSPVVWQKAVFGKIPTGSSKDAAIAFCAEKIPTLDLYPRTKKTRIRKKTPHIGIADAACIAYWLKESRF